MEATAGDLCAELIEGGVADDRVVLKGNVEVARLIVASARAGVLTKDLILRRGGETGDKRGRDANAEEGIVAVVPALVDAGRPQAGLFRDRVVAANAIETDKRRWQWRKPETRRSALHGVYQLSCGA